MSRQTIVFVINSLHTGGAERVLERLLSCMGGREQRYDVHVVLLDDDPQMITLPDKATLHVLDSRKGLWRSIVQLRALLRRLDPAVSISFLVRANVANALAIRALRGKAVLCERMHLSSHLAGRYAGVKLALLRALPRMFYPLADQILAVSEGVRRDLVESFGFRPDFVRTIFNPYDLEAIRRQGEGPAPIILPERFIAGVGRFVEAKNFAMLVDAYAAASPDLPLVILGEGEERGRLEQQIAAHGLGDRILMPGYVSNPFAVVSRAEFFVSASRNEGFPNAIAEAMVLGVPVLATDCPSGPAELLGAQADEAGEVVAAPHGLIVGNNDVAGLQKGISLYADAGLRDRYGAAGKARMADFRIEVIAEEYWVLIDGFAGRAG